MFCGGRGVPHINVNILFFFFSVQTLCLKKECVLKMIEQESEARERSQVGPKRLIPGYCRKCGNLMAVIYNFCYHCNKDINQSSGLDWSLGGLSTVRNDKCGIRTSSRLGICLILFLTFILFGDIILTHHMPLQKLHKPQVR